MGFRRKDSSSSTVSTTSAANANTIWHNVGIPRPSDLSEPALLEANYAAYYQSDTYHKLSAVAADLGVERPTLDPSAKEYIGNPVPEARLGSVSSAYSRSASIPTTYHESEPLSPGNNGLFSQSVSFLPEATEATAVAWPGTFNPEEARSNWSNVPEVCNNIQCKPRRTCPKHEHLRSQSVPTTQCCQGPNMPYQPRSEALRSNSVPARPVSEIPVDISEPWNPTLPPYSKYFTPAKSVDIDAEADEGIGRPMSYDGNKHRLSELIDPADLLPDSYSHFGSVSSLSSSYSNDDTFGRSSRSVTRGTTPATSASSSRASSRNARNDSVKPLPPVLEAPSGALFSASEFAAHPNRPLAIRERQEHIRAAIESIEFQNRLSRSASRKESADSAWKTGFGSDGRKGSRSGSTGSVATAYGGFGHDGRGGAVKTLEEMRIEEGRRAYDDKSKKSDRSWSLSALRGRKASS